MPSGSADTTFSSFVWASSRLLLVVFAADFVIRNLSPDGQPAVALFAELNKIELLDQEAYARFGPDGNEATANLYREAFEDAGLVLGDDMPQDLKRLPRGAKTCLLRAWTRWTATAECEDGFLLENYINELDHHPVRSEIREWIHNGKIQQVVNAVDRWTIEDLDRHPSYFVHDEALRLARSGRNRAAISLMKTSR
jgi:hypothetical protein